MSALLKRMSYFVIHNLTATLTASRPQVQHKLLMFKVVTENVSFYKHPDYFLHKNGFSMPIHKVFIVVLMDINIFMSC